MPPGKKSKGSIRRGQLVGTYGVGAVIPLGDESFMIAGTDRWNVSRPNLFEPRLQRQLHVQGFVLPPASEGYDIPVLRFPNIYSCPICHRLDQHRFFTIPTENKCGQCNAPLVPSRFIVACNLGHIDDFPYFEWVHVGTVRDDTKQHVLSIDAKGVSASLTDIRITCTCGKSSTMKGSFARDALKGVKKCTGKRPWLGDNVDCTEYPRTLQRGASNVYFSVVSSAISIPPWSEGAFKILNMHWNMIRYVPDNALPDVMAGVAKGTEYSADDLVIAVRQRKEMEAGAEPATSEDSLKKQEYEALMHGKAETSREQDFVCIRAEPSAEVDSWFDRVMLVKRLREVRALYSFTRLLPSSPSDLPERLAPLSAVPMDWLPAIEVLGEGVFLTLNSGRLESWERRADVLARAKRIDSRYVAGFAAHKLAADRVITPRLLLLHTLAHVLINQWALESGYPSASLRERLYVSDDMAGLLIYTATSDSAGSLGGLVSQAESDRLVPALDEAIARTSWCSADPLCIEADAAGVDSLNLAACHACALLPETSCEEANRLLDRALLVGTPENPDLGFFASLVERI
jgi:hypothetical protein